jgi:polyisoprenoid-binding protein YceI
MILSSYELLRRKNIGIDGIHIRRCHLGNFMCLRLAVQCPGSDVRLSAQWACIVTPLCQSKRNFEPFLKSAFRMTRTTKRRHMRVTVVALALLLALPVSALLAEESTPPKAAVNPGDINVGASRVYTFVEKTGLGHQHAIEGKLSSGHLMLGAESSAGQLVFNMRSFDADTTAARRYLGLKGTTGESTRSQVNANMKGSAVLDVSRYPSATFDVASAKATDRKSKSGLPIYELVGTFTLRGKQRPLRVRAEVERASGWLHVRGNFAVKQTSYGITPYSKAFGAVGVADALRIHGDLWVAPNTQVSMTGIPERK